MPNPSSHSDFLVQRKLSSSMLQDYFWFLSTLQAIDRSKIWMKSPFSEAG